jgi:hypothetical protein
MTSSLFSRIVHALSALHDLEIDSRGVNESLVAVQQTLASWQDNSRSGGQGVLNSVIGPLDSAIQDALLQTDWVSAAAHVNTALLTSVEPLVRHSRDAALGNPTDSRRLSFTEVERDTATLLFTVSMFLETSRHTLFQTEVFMDRLGEKLANLVAGYTPSPHHTLH